MRKNITFLFVTLLIIVTLAILVTKLLTFNQEYPITVLEKGWTVTYHNEQYQNTNLERISAQIGQKFNRGDMLTLVYTKPISTPDVPFPYMRFKSRFCAYEIFFNDDLIYSEYLDALDSNSYVGMGYVNIPLPRSATAEKLTMKLYVTENNTIVDLMSPRIGNFDDLYRENLGKVKFPLFAGIFLLLFGQVMLIRSLLFYLRSSGVSTQVTCSMLSMMIGVWIITAYDCSSFVATNPFCTFWAYASEYLLMPLVYLLIYNLHKRYNNLVVIVLGSASMFFTILFLLLHALNIVHINHFQFPYVGISLVGLIILFYYVRADIKHRVKNPTTNTLMLGVCVLGIIYLIYTMYSLFGDYIDYRQNLIFQFLPIGAMFFAFLQLLNYLIFMTHTSTQKKVYASLKQIAYADNLTGLPNRASCDKKILEFGKSDKEYCILSLDLDGLKEVNDNAGHPAGDRLLKSFAKALSDTFSDIGFCCRTGGDEFLVLIEEIAKNELDDRLKTLDERLAKLDEEDPEVNHSVSYGYAYRSEAEEGDTHSVFILADQRMYECKKSHYTKKR